MLSYFSRFAFVSTSTRSLIATTSSVSPCRSLIALKTCLPIRPKPLIPILVATVYPVVLRR